VLKLRNEKAELLGFKNFAELSMASKVRGARKGNKLV
jgi:Zn-dependent oligopeptidase